MVKLIQSSNLKSDGQTFSGEEEKKEQQEEQERKEEEEQERKDEGKREGKQEEDYDVKQMRLIIPINLHGNDGLRESVLGKISVELCSKGPGYKGISV